MRHEKASAVQVAAEDLHNADLFLFLADICQSDPVCPHRQPGLYRHVDPWTRSITLVVQVECTCACMQRHKVLNDASRCVLCSGIVYLTPCWLTLCSPVVCVRLDCAL
jgi:hypothetical protein